MNTTNENMNLPKHDDYGGYQILVQKVFEGDLSCDWHIQETQSTFSK